MALVVKVKWTGAAGENYAYSAWWDGTYICVGLYIDPAIMIRFNPTTLIEVDRWTGVSGEWAVSSIVHSGSFLYLTLLHGTSGNGEVVQLNKSNLTESDRYVSDGGGGGSIITDGTYLYYSTSSTFSGKVIKIKMADMTEVGRLTGTSKKYYYGLAFIGGYLYAGLKDITAYPVVKGTIEKIDPADMSVVASWSEAIGAAYGASLCQDGSYLYLGLPVSPGVVVQFDTDLTEIDRWTGATGENLPLASTLGESGYVYAALATSPAKVIKLKTSDMTKSDIWTGATGENDCYGVAFDGSNPFATLYLSPGQVVKLGIAILKIASRGYIIG